MMENVVPELYNLLPGLMVIVGCALLASLGAFSNKLGAKWIYLLSLVGHLGFLAMLLPVRTLSLGPFLVIASDQWFLLFTMSLLSMFAIFLHGYKNPRDGVSISLLNFAFIMLVFFWKANNLLIVYIALEMLTFITCIQISFDKSQRAKVNGLKFLINNIVFSLLFLVGIAFFYGATGGLDLGNIVVENSRFYTISILLMFTVCCFKLGVFPFHFWMGEIFSKMKRNNIINYFFFVHPLLVFALFHVMQKMLLFVPLEIVDEFNNVFLWFACVGAIYGLVKSFARKNLIASLVDLYISYLSIAIASFVLANSGRIQEELLFYLLSLSVPLSAILLICGHYSQGNDIGKRKIEFSDDFYKNRAIRITLIILVLGFLGLPLTFGFYTRFAFLTMCFKEGLHNMSVISTIVFFVGLGYGAKLYNEIYGKRNLSEIERPVLVKMRSEYAVLVVGLLVILGGIYPLIRGLYLN